MVSTISLVLHTYWGYNTKTHACLQCRFGVRVYTCESIFVVVAVLLKLNAYCINKITDIPWDKLKLQHICLQLVMHTYSGANSTYIHIVHLRFLFFLSPPSTTNSTMLPGDTFLVHCSTRVCTVTPAQYSDMHCSKILQNLYCNISMILWSSSQARKYVSMHCNLDTAAQTNKTWISGIPNTLCIHSWRANALIVSQNYHESSHRYNFPTV